MTQSFSFSIKLIQFNFYCIERSLLFKICFFKKQLDLLKVMTRTNFLRRWDVVIKKLGNKCLYLVKKLDIS